MGIGPGDRLAVQLEHQPQHAVGGRVLGAEVELHVPHELLRLGHPAGVREQDGVVLILWDVKVILHANYYHHFQQIRRTRNVGTCIGVFSSFIKKAKEK